MKHRRTNARKPNLISTLRTKPPRPIFNVTTRRISRTISWRLALDMTAFSLEEDFAHRLLYSTVPRLIRQVVWQQDLRLPVPLSNTVRTHLHLDQLHFPFPI